VVLHAFELHDRRYLDGFTPLPLRVARRVFVISRRDVSIVRDRWAVDAALLRMGVPRAWLVSGDERRQIEHDRSLVVSVGSLIPKKGHHVLLRALALADPSWRLEVAGEGSDRGALESLARQLGLEGRVRFLGLVPEGDVRALVDRARVMCLASIVTPDGDRDGVPVALMEAMARRVPVVSTDVGAIAELVEGAGLLVPPSDPEALARALDSLRDDSLHERLGAAAEGRIEADYVAEDVAAAVVELAR
jgi:glycosyltransferase involved in cell wall biosynthesis